MAFVEEIRLGRRAQLIYERTVQILPWANIAMSTREVIRDRARTEIWQEGKLLSSPPNHRDDGAYSQLVELDCEAAEGMHGGN